MQLENQRGVIRYEAWGLIHVDVFSQILIKEGIINVNLLYIPLISESKCEDNPDSCRLDDMWKIFPKILSREMIVAFSY